MLRTPSAAIVRRAAQRILPLAVWLGAIAGVLWLLPRAGRSSPIVGIVEANRCDVVVPVAGNLASIGVDRHTRIEAGQVVARLGDEPLRLRLTQARYELEALRARMQRSEAEAAFELRRDAARQENDAAIELRRRTSAVESAQLDELETRTQIEEARIRLHGLEIETERQSSLVRQDIAADAVLIRVRTDQDAVRQRIAELENLLAGQRTRTAAARTRLQDYSTTAATRIPPDTLIEPLRWQLKVQETAIERIALEARQLDLVAPNGGYVEAVHLSPGQWVTAGSKLLTIVDPDARRILAYVPAEARNGVDVAGRVYVSRSGLAQRRPATVLSMSAGLVPVPLRLRRDPRLEEWAWEMVLAAADDDAAGDRVSVVPGR